MYNERGIHKGDWKRVLRKKRSKKESWYPRDRGRERCLERENMHTSALLNAAMKISKFRPQNLSGFTKKEVSDELACLMGFPVEWGRRTLPPTPF